VETPNEKRIVPTISRVCGDTIVELVYDAAGGQTGLVVFKGGRWTIEQSLEITTGETLVPYAAGNNLIRHECVLLPSEPVSSGGKAQVLADIEAYLHRYVDLLPAFERIAAHYVLLTWLFDAFNEVPYLRFKGDFGSGKTRALIALGGVVYKGFFASAASTVSPIFHTLDRFGGTLILDEADLRFSDKTADLVKILNNGTVKGLPVLRTLQNPQKEFNPAAFSVFGPKIVAMRGTFRDPALESRFITEEMGRRPLREGVPIQLPKTLKSEAHALRNRLLHFRLMNLFSVKSDPSRLIEGIDPRLNQTALSLLSLIDDASLRESFAETLRERHAQLAAERTQSVEARTLSALMRLAERAEGTFISVKDITHQVNADEFADIVSARDVGRVLRVRSLPLYKSNGMVGVPKSALSAMAKIRKTTLGGPKSAPPQSATLGDN
jgi:hypothetical protein